MNEVAIIGIILAVSGICLGWLLHILYVRFINKNTGDKNEIKNNTR